MRPGFTPEIYLKDVTFFLALLQTPVFLLLADDCCLTGLLSRCGSCHMSDGTSKQRSAPFKL